MAALKRTLNTSKDTNEPTSKVLRLLLMPSVLFTSPSTSIVEEKLCSCWEEVGRIADLPALKMKIKNDEGFLQINSAFGYLLTDSMRALLLHIIDDLVAELEKPILQRRKVLLYHGMTGIGKSVLARVLEYYLGLIYKITWFIGFRHQLEPTDTDAAVSQMGLTAPSACFPKGVPPQPLMLSVCICDQVNCDSISASRFLSACRMREFPVIMFTSGYFIPCGEWCACFDTIKVEVIHMTLTVAEGVVLSQLSKEIVTDLFSVSSTCGSLLRMSASKDVKDVEEKKQLCKVDYTNPSLLELVQVVWSGTYDLMKVLSFEEAKQQNVFQLTRQDMRHYQLFMQNKKVSSDQKYNGIFNQLIPIDVTENDRERSPTYMFFPFENAVFEIVSKEQLAFYNFCKEIDVGERAVLKSALDLFSSSSGSLQGLCFELLIRLHCQTNHCGLRPTELYMVNHKGVKVCEASDCKSLVNQLICKSDCPQQQQHEMNLWFSLDVRHRMKYPGFDFALASGKADHSRKTFDLASIHLIQATVSLQSKTLEKRSLMVREYNKLICELIRQKCVRDERDHMKLSCHFCLPYAETDKQQTVKLVLRPEHELGITTHFRELMATVVRTEKKITCLIEE